MAGQQPKRKAQEPRAKSTAKAPAKPRARATTSTPKAAARKAPAKKAPTRRPPAKRTAPTPTPPATTEQTDPTDPTEPRNRERVEAHVAQLRKDNDLDTQREALAELALTLAGLLDGGSPVAMTDKWAKTLLMTLVALAPKAVPDDDRDDWVGDLTPDPAVPAEVRDPT